jgi:hypothetical protein
MKTNAWFAPVVCLVVACAGCSSTAGGHRADSKPASHVISDAPKDSSGAPLGPRTAQGAASSRTAASAGPAGTQLLDPRIGVDRGDMPCPPASVISGIAGFPMDGSTSSVAGGLCGYYPPGEANVSADDASYRVLTEGTNVRQTLQQSMAYDKSIARAWAKAGLVTKFEPITGVGSPAYHSYLTGSGHACTSNISDASGMAFLVSYSSKTAADNIDCRVSDALAVYLITHT